jgi:UDP-N-acetylmuramoyl-L-alanyl-D-glutamate--2,6-diaminopimelate ligase
VRLGQLIADVEDARLRGDPGVEVRGLAYDSRYVQPGDLFMTWRGLVHDGHAFVGEALARGAVACLVEKPGVVPPPAAEVFVPDARPAIARVAARFFGHPTRQLRLVGVTGTKGKTTTAFLCREALATLGPCGLIGTVTAVVGGVNRQVARTTPEATDLQRTFREMVDAGDRYCVMEVSSHALALHRVDACEFDAAVFTNLGRDHLDLHGTQEAYREAKARLFAMLGEPREKPPAVAAVVNADDPAGEVMARRAAAPVVTYGFGEAAAVRGENLLVEPDGLRMRVAFPGGVQPVRLRLTGRFNAYNALAAFAVGLAFGAAPEAVAAALGRLAGVPGRFERIPGSQPFTVVVDYAHTPDSLRNVLETAREFAAGRVIAVFGAGGDRDRTKRPLMGEVAARLADLVILTSDNPRSEDPLAILDDIAAGVRRVPGAAWRVVADRRDAIFAAVGEAREGDVVLIAGKGHETYQIFRDRTVHFDDREVASEALRSRGY